MLENLRDKLLNVQHELSASLKNLKAGEAALTRSFQLRKQKHYGCQINAGADLLHHYQKQWEELHGNNEENAQLAEGVRTMIEDLHQSCQQQCNAVQQLNFQLAQVPRLQTSVMSLMNKIGELEGLFEEVEGALVNLQDVIETQEVQEKQLDQRFQLALYKEKKLSQLEDTKMKLAEDHAKSVRDFEQRQQEVLKERQDTFKEVFEEEMEMYKTFGRIDRVPSNPSKSAELEEIQLDEDEEDQSKLDAFLGDISLHSDGTVSNLEETDGGGEESDAPEKSTSKES